MADGTLGLYDEGPYDGIVVTGATSGLPLTYFEQLYDGGRIVIPLGESSDQALYVFHRTAAEVIIESRFEGFRFLPLVSDERSTENGRSVAASNPHASNRVADISEMACMNDFSAFSTVV